MTEEEEFKKLGDTAIIPESEIKKYGISPAVEYFKEYYVEKMIKSLSENPKKLERFEKALSEEYEPWTPE